jgi:limonene-1,2-epoxide hydrolase
MSEAAQFELIRKLFATFDAKDAVTLAGFVTSDVRMRLGNAPLTTGKSAFIDAYGAFVTSVAGVRHEIFNLWRDGNIVIAQLDVHYERLDGGEVTLPCCNVFQLCEGLVSEYRSYMDAGPVYATTT